MRITIVDQGVVLYSSTDTLLNNFCIEEEYVQSQDNIDEYNRVTWLYDHQMLEQELRFE